MGLWFSVHGRCSAQVSDLADTTTAQGDDSLTFASALGADVTSSVAYGEPVR